MSDSARSVPDWVVRLAAAAREVDGAPPFSDGALVDYRMGRRSLVAVDESAAALTTGAEAEFVVHPDARGRGHGTRLLETLLGSASGPMLFWAHGDHPAARALAESHGLAPVRELLHLAAELPILGDAGVPTSPDVGSSRIGEFETGRDEDEWVALNSRIFAHHAEQGSVTRSDLVQLESETWFDASDFLVLRDDAGAMIGYCWVKVEGGVGEIYVVGVSPEHQGERLGARLFDAGLARMRERGIRRAHLYVEGDNIQALPLYRARGFTQDSIDIQYSSAFV